MDKVSFYKLLVCVWVCV